MGLTVKKRQVILDGYLVTIVRLVAHGLDQDLCDFRTRELHRRDLPRTQHLPHLRPRKRDTALHRMRTGLGGSHPLATVAPERVLELQRHYPDRRSLELLEDTLRIVGAI